jgi:prepilin-type N-terminal cleavage/methylation domain-containing protein
MKGPRMAKFKNEKGLTLIELLITIAVLAVVSAIALPVINNVVSSSNSNAAVQTQSDVNDFIAKYNAAGETLLSTDGRTLQGYVDTDGDNTIDSNELVDTLSIDSKFAVQFPMTSSSDSVGGSYTSDGIVPPVITLASGGVTGGPTTGPIAPSGDVYTASAGLFLYVDFYGNNAGSAAGNVHFQENYTNSALFASLSTRNTWTVTVETPVGSSGAPAGNFTYTVNVNASATDIYLSTDWSTWDTNNISNYAPNFYYDLSSVTVNEATGKLIFVIAMK